MRIIMAIILASMAVAVLSIVVVPGRHEQVMPGQSLATSLDPKDEIQ
ncbi:hypothetical protein JNB88_22825 [Rhizobium cauense]|nr:hypothetical protein [Rhizobium cauense]MBW9116475.1 hypothetical protein [Rhizobium cauense]